MPLDIVIFALFAMVPIVTMLSSAENCNPAPESEPDVAVVAANLPPVFKIRRSTLATLDPTEVGAFVPICILPI